VQQGEKLADHPIFDNPFDSKDNFKFFGAFPGKTASNLKDGVLPTTPLNGVSRYLVPHSDENLHPVVLLAQANIKDDLSSAQRKKFKETIPPELMSESADNPGFYLMSQSLFDKYHARCQTKLREKNPLSDVANPHGAMWVSARDLKAAAASMAPVSSQSSSVKGFTKSHHDADLVASNNKSLWLTAPEIDTNRVTAAGKESARDTRYNFFCRLRIESLNATELAVN
jgi:hypothetical protein